MSNLPQKIQEVFQRATCIYTKEQIEVALDAMAIAITEKLQDKNPLVLCVMIGGLIPLGNLLLRLDFPLEVDYVHATRYQGDIHSGDLHWKVEPPVSIADRTVLIVDDILDGGLTLSSIVDFCKNQQAKEVLTAVLVDKHHPREKGGLASCDFCGLRVEDRYIFGYGMDYKEYLRNAPGIYMVDPRDQ